MIRVAVVDDHPHVAIALRALLNQTAGISLVAKAWQGSEVFSLVQRECPHLLLLDLLISRIESIVGDLVVGRLYLSLQAYEALAQAALQAGDHDLLTKRERDILRLAKRGLPKPQIAQALHLSPGMVRNHLSADGSSHHTLCLSIWPTMVRVGCTDSNIKLGLALRPASG